MGTGVAAGAAAAPNRKHPSMEILNFTDPAV
jgi:hypothetical protein